MAADAIGARSPLTNDAAVRTVGVVRSGCDPGELDAVAARCRALAGRVRDCRRRAEQLRAARWSGPVAVRRRVELAELSVRLGGAAVMMDHLGRRLERHAAEQRRASLGAPAASVLRARAAGVGDGERVVRVGAPEAAVVVVLVPGVGTDPGDRDALDAAARRVWEALAVRAERDGLGQDAVAVVSWLGYDPPDHLIAGLSRSPAALGGRRLAADVAGWRRDGAERIVVVGHSYGALVAARASASGMRADELVVLGAPGLGVADRSSLRLAPGAELWAAAARTDVIGLLARLGVVHGPDPTVVASPLPAAGPGHGSYLQDPGLLEALADLALHDPRPAGTVAAPAS
jgi:pimeloyl-ACP methyl ester carboxylesterase